MPGLVSDSDLDVPDLLRLEKGIIQIPANAKLLLTPLTVIEGGNNSSFINGAVSYTISSPYDNFTASYPLSVRH